MLKKILSLFKKQEVEEEEDTGTFLISYSLDDNDEVYIHIEANKDEYDVGDLAKLLNYISSISGQKDTLDLIKGALEERGEGYHESFIGHFFTLKRKEADSIDKVVNPQENPCIDPLDML